MPASASAEQLRHVVEAAGLAPSVHNTQPWQFTVRPDGLDLRADPARRLEVLDPDGRQLHLSCGAALFHAKAAARGVGLEVAVQLLPDPSDPDLLAQLRITAGAAPTEQEATLAAAILRRHTFRGTFEDRPVPAGLIEQLRLDAEREGALLHEVSRRDDLLELEVLLSHADADEEQDGRYRRELAHWVQRDATALDGLAAASLGTAPGSSLRQRDFTLTHAPATDGSTPTADHPMVCVLVTQQDDHAAWLRAGQALAAVLLRAAAAGVQAQPLGQVTDLLAYRLRLGTALGVLGCPQLVLRMGYAHHVGAAPRRAVEDVLAPVAG